MTTRVRSVDISTISQDPHNANKGSERGRAMLEQSLRRLKAGRGIVYDRNRVTIAGNKTIEEWVALGGKVIEIDSDGTELIAVRRTDLDLLDPNDSTARQLAYADNRVQEVDFVADPSVLKEDFENPALNISWLYTEDERKAVLEHVEFDANVAQGDAEEEEIPTMYGVIIECRTEQEQVALLTRLSSEGYTCKALLS